MSEAEPETSTTRFDERKPLRSVFRAAVEKAEEDGALSVYELVELFGARSLGPVLMIFGLVILTPPLGLIPGLPSSMAFLTLLFAAQFLFGRDHIWVPRFIGKRAISASLLEEAERRATRILERIDALVRSRLTFLTSGAMSRVAALVVCVVAVLTPPLELIPFAAAAPAFAFVLFGLAITAHDGLLMAIGFALAAGVGALLVAFWPF